MGSSLFSDRARCCGACGGQTRFALHAYEMQFGTREVFDYLECSECGCLQLDAAAESSAVDAVDPYGDDYYTRRQRLPSSRGGGGLGVRRAWTRFRLREHRCARALSGRRYGRFDWFRRTRTGVEDAILDVGCGSGRLLLRLRKEGFRDLTGIDPNLAASPPDAAGLRFERVSLEAHAETQPGRYRLVMAHHSFEHMHDPRRCFEALARLLAPGGHLLLRIPRADSWACRHYRRHWVQLDAPRHRHLHTRRSIEALARQSGLRLAAVVDDSGPFQIWGSELYRRDIALHEVRHATLPERLANRTRRLRARWRARRIAKQGLGDQACFYFVNERAGDDRAPT